MILNWHHDCNISSMREKHGEHKFNLSIANTPEFPTQETKLCGLIPSIFQSSRPGMIVQTGILEGEIYVCLHQWQQESYCGKGAKETAQLVKSLPEQHEDPNLIHRTQVTRGTMAHVGKPSAGEVETAGLLPSSQLSLICDPPAPREGLSQTRWRPLVSTHMHTHAYICTHTQ